MFMKIKFKVFLCLVVLLINYNNVTVKIVVSTRKVSDFQAMIIGVVVGVAAILIINLIYCWWDYNKYTRNNFSVLSFISK